VPALFTKIALSIDSLSQRELSAALGAEDPRPPPLPTHRVLLVPGRPRRRRSPSSCSARSSRARRRLWPRARGRRTPPTSCWSAPPPLLNPMSEGCSPTCSAPLPVAAPAPVPTHAYAMIALVLWISPPCLSEFARPQVLILLKLFVLLQGSQFVLPTFRWQERKFWPVELIVQTKTLPCSRSWLAARAGRSRPTCARSTSSR
jgi:hypothetical protein